MPTQWQLLFTRTLPFDREAYIKPLYAKMPVLRRL